MNNLPNDLINLLRQKIAAQKDNNKPDEEDIENSGDETVNDEGESADDEGESDDDESDSSMEEKEENPMKDESNSDEDEDYEESSEDESIDSTTSNVSYAEVPDAFAGYIAGPNDIEVEVSNCHKIYYTFIFVFRKKLLNICLIKLKSFFEIGTQIQQMMKNVMDMLTVFMI